MIASGMTLVWAVTKHLHVAHGDFLIVCMFACYSLYTAWRLDPYISAFILAPLMFILGLLVFLFLFQPLMNKSGGLVSFVAFLGLSYAIESILSMFYGAEQISTPSFISGFKLTIQSLKIPVLNIVAFVVSVSVCLGFHRILKGTDFGRSIRAVAQNAGLAGLMGINVKRIQMVVFGLAFVLLAVAASLLAPIWIATSYMGLNFTLFAFIILAMGGMDNFMGVFISSILIGLLEAYSNFFLGPALAPALPYICFILILLFRPMGLFARKS